MIIKSRNKADTDEAQRHYWWSKTPEERLAAAEKLNELARKIYEANPANPLLNYGKRVLKSPTPIPRGER